MNVGVVFVTLVLILTVLAGLAVFGSFVTFLVRTIVRLVTK